MSDRIVKSMEMKVSDMIVKSMEIYCDTKINGMQYYIDIPSELYGSLHSECYKKNECCIYGDNDCPRQNIKSDLRDKRINNIIDEEI